MRTTKQIFTWTAVFSVLCAASAHGITYAQLALGGSEGFSFKCILQVTNKREVAWDGVVWLKGTGDEKGWPWEWSVNGRPGNGNDFTFTLPPKGSATFVLRGDDQARAGALTLGYDSVLDPGYDYDTDRPEVATVTTFFYQLSRDGMLIDSIGTQVSAFGSSFVFPIVRTDTVNTGVAWVYRPFLFRNLARARTIELSIRNEQGRLRYAKTIEVPGEGLSRVHQAQYVAQLFPELEENFHGTMEIHVLGDTLDLTVLRQDVLPGGGVQLTGVSVFGEL